MSGTIIKLIYQSFLPYQGRYPRVSGQAQILRANGLDVTVLACDREASHPIKEKIEGVSVERIPVKTGEMVGPLAQLLPLTLFSLRAMKSLRTRSFNVLHCHNLDVLFLGWLVKRIKPCAVVFDAHEPNYYALWPSKWRFFLKLIDKFEIFLAKGVDLVTVTNEYQVNKYQKAGVKRVELVGNYPLPHLRIQRLPEEKFKNGTVTFGRIGTVYPDAGFEQIFAAFSKIIDVIPEARLLIAGRVVEKYVETFSSLLASLNPHVEYLGPYSAEQMVDIYNKIDFSLLIYPKNDWFRNITPRKFFDSVANGVPVIMTDIGGLGEVIEKRECGLVVDEKDIDSITRAMVHVLENPRLRKKMALNALNLALTEYDWQGMAVNYVNMQKELIMMNNQTGYL